jgi:hypothetical protein
MSVHKVEFVLVNNMTPRNSSVCAECSRPLERGYLHDLSTSRLYCGVECYPRWIVVSGSIANIAHGAAIAADPWNALHLKLL